MRRVKASLFLLIFTTNHNHILAMEYIGSVINYMQEIELDRVYEQVKNFFVNDKKVLLYSGAIGLGTLFIFDWYKKTTKLNKLADEVAHLKENMLNSSEMARIETRLDLIAAKFDIIIYDLNHLWQYIFTPSKISRYCKKHCRPDDVQPVRPHITGKNLDDRILQRYIKFEIENRGYKGDDVPQTLNGFSFRPIGPVPPSPRKRNNSPPLRSGSPVHTNDKMKKTSPRNGTTKKTKKLKKRSSSSSSGDSQSPPHEEKSFEKTILGKET